MFSVVLNPPVSGRILNTSTPAVGHFQPAAEALLQNLPPSFLPLSYHNFPALSRGKNDISVRPRRPIKPGIYTKKSKRAGRNSVCRSLQISADAQISLYKFINSCFHTPAARFRRPLRSVKEKRRCAPEGPGRALPCPFCRP